MKLLLLAKPVYRRILAVGILAFMSMNALAQNPTLSPDEKAAESAARQWVELLDNAKYADSWDKASDVFQRVPRDKWIGVVQQVRQKAGKMQDRELLEAKFTTTIPHAPEGRYVVVRYKTQFSNPPLTLESVLMTEQNGAWKTMGYALKAWPSVPAPK